ncbi:cytochrome P450 736A117-like [Salvia miltiorrhiza]|uniref:cytochrome P450 736A117-like n=1 Tax=Salvia miltiorrhiza TaxID=226208 RepID=UPI0025AD9249|nr:cytochrome P450 736A117-like [Salvia miltiorrhiza]
MEEFKYLIPLILTSILSLIFLLCSIVKRKKLPPSPLKLPIIGNLHQVGSLPHRDLHSLARKHGPLMLLHLGSAPALIVSSADSACEIMRTHDLVFASRPVYKAFQKLLYGCKDVASAPYGDHWRRMKSILVLQLLSNKRVQTFRSIREEETAIFLKKIQESAGPVNLSEIFKKLNNDGVCRAAFGRKYSETENGKKFLLLLSDLMELLGSIDVGDFIPWLAWIGRLNGFDRKLDRVAKGMDQVLESVFQERSNGAHGKDGDNCW